MSPKVSIVVGNPKPNSRTLKIAQKLVRRLFGADGYSLHTVDLAEYAAELFIWPSSVMTELNSAVASSDFVIASPTYKATYTGLLKAFLDRYPANGLKGVFALSVMTGADRGHSMAPAASLSPLLVELGAIVPFHSFYFAINEMDRTDEVIDAFAKGVRSHPRELEAVRKKLAGFGSRERQRARSMNDAVRDHASFTSRQFKDALSHYASGLTIISGSVDGRPAGFTCQSFYSVSLDPPLVSFSVNVTSSTWPLIRSTGAFSVNILADEQHHISTNFGRSGIDRWSGVDTRLTKKGNPVIVGTLMWLDCDIYETHRAGDHDIVVGCVREMSSFELSDERAPLVFFKGRYMRTR